MIRRRELWAGLHQSWIALQELALMPIGIGEGEFAGGVETGDLGGGERPADSTEVLAELLLVARADDERGDGGAAEKPVEGDLRDGLTGFAGNFVEGVDDGVEMLFGDLGTHVLDELGVEAGGLGDAGSRGGSSR